MTLRERSRLIAQGARFQPFWEWLFNKSVAGMNYWNSARFTTSGELVAVQRQLADKENVTFIDVGANNGEYAAAISGLLTASATIHCFEPLPSMFAELERNTADLANVHRHKFGLSDESGRLRLYFSESREELSSVYDNVPDHDASDSVEIEVRTLDEFVRDAGITHIDFLKIDVEGHELSVLEGAAGTLTSGGIDHIQFEFGEGMIVSRTFFRDFWDLLSPGYIIYRILPRGLREITAYNRHLEIFTCVNFLAVKRSAERK